jgi:biopolymer transport protein ExbB/TolQ
MEVLELIFNKINSGGFVMWALLFLSFMIWSMLFRYSYLLDRKANDGFYQKLKSVLVKSEKSRTSELVQLWSERISIEEKMILSLIAIAPLMGLLGTVGGMIETFASLETMEMFRPGGGIADGISQALLTTQLGLIVAVPSLMILKWTQRKKNNLLVMINHEMNMRMKKDEI